MKFALLALLAKAPAHGYELKQAYEDLFGAVLPPLNAGQIYTTLGRLERDKLVSDHFVEQDDRPDKRVYQLTEKGHTALHQWIGKVSTGAHLKDDFFSKLILARTAEIADQHQLIEQQRDEYLQQMHRLNEEMRHQDNSVAILLIEGAILHLQADLKWLDRCQEELAGR